MAEQKFLERTTIVLASLNTFVLCILAVLQFNIQRDVSKINTRISQEQLVVTKANCVISLLPKMVSGSDCEKNASMAIIKSLQAPFEQKLFESVAREKCFPLETRLSAIAGLGAGASDPSALEAIRSFKEENISPQNKIEATAAEQEIFGRMVSIADAFFAQGRMEQAAKNYEVASRHIEREQSVYSTVDVSKLLIAAKSSYDHGDFANAAQNYRKALHRVR